MRTKYKVLRCVLLSSILLAAGTIVRTAGASEARHHSLGQNPMVQDMVDIVDYAGMTAAYGNSVFLNVAQVAPFGNAGFLIGDGIVGGVWINRTPRFDDLAKTDELFSSFNLPAAYNIADLFLGTRVGFGIRLSFSTGIDSLDTQTEPDSDSVYSDGESLFSMEVAPGFSFETGYYHGDFGVGLTLSHFKVAIGGETAFTSKLVPSALIRHRSVIGPQENTAWVLDVGLTTRNYTAEAKGDNTAEGRFTHVIATLVVGPRFRLPQDITVWAGFRALIEHLSGEVASIKQPRLTGIGTPGLVLSGEVEFLDYFAFRAGVNYDVYWNIESTPDSADQDNDGDEDEILAKRRGMGQRFSWSSGLGVTLGSFQIDGTISQNLYFDGPNIIGGNAPGFLGMLSATYMW
jgi:hypothetical protein